MDNKALIYSMVIGVLVLGLGGFFIWRSTNIGNLSQQISSSRQVIEPAPQVDFASIRAMGISEREEFFDLPIDVLQLSLGKDDPFSN